MNELLQQYLAQARTATSHDAKRIRFLDFVRSAFGIDLAQFEIETRVYKGWVDAILGTLVFEFKTDLSREMDDARQQLGRYITDLRKKYPGTNYTGIATDGIVFVVFKPSYAQDGVQVIGLEPIGELDLEREIREGKAEQAFLWLDTLLFHFRKEKVAPTTQHIVAHLGPASPTFGSTGLSLYRLFQEVKDDPAVRVRFEEWRKYLAVVYGQEVGDEALFLRHTYLATIAKLMASFTLGLLPALAAQRMEEIVTGRAFQNLGIANFIEEDFFTWFLQPQAKERGLDLTRRLVHSLQMYDFAAVNEDMLKGLYEELVDPTTRHDLGEYYTPDWLARYILDQIGLLQEPRMSLLDPACGSGTFLFTAIRLIKEELRKQGVDEGQILAHILSNIMGIDVHPLAVIIARTNYILAIQELLAPGRTQVSIPVYLADAILLMEVTRPLEGAPEDAPDYEGLYHFVREGKTFGFPESLVADPTRLDSLIEAMRPWLDPALGDNATQGFNAILGQAGLSDTARSALAENFRMLFDLRKEGKDTVWLFILKNQPKPLSLSQHKFDAVVGNPPWLSLRYIQNPDYLRWVRDQMLNRYHILDRKKAHLFTHLEEATLFFVRAADLYLKEGGTIGFVMPKGVMVADQHGDFFNRFEFAVRPMEELTFELKHVADLEGVSPLFNVPACVLVATKGGLTTWPISATRFSGNLPSKNLSWEEAEPHLQSEAIQLRRIGGKLLPEGTLLQYRGTSYYANRFYDGATIYPRNLWFVQIPASPLGFDIRAPYMETSEVVARNAKKPWDTVRVSGSVEACFLYGTLLGGDILPFGHCSFRRVVLPIARQGSVPGWGRGPSLIGRREAAELGFHGLARWLADAEREWEAKAKKDPEGKLNLPNLVKDQLDYRRKLSKQLTGRRYKVLYNASGTNISAVVVDTTALPPLEVGGTRLTFQGFVAECTTFYCETDSVEEAHYLAAIFNSPLLDELIKPLQPRGLWGERHIHKKPLQFSIPGFNGQDADHRTLAQLSQECHQRVAPVAPELARRYRNAARQRQEARRLVADQLAQIDQLVAAVLAASP